MTLQGTERLREEHCYWVARTMVQPLGWSYHLGWKAHRVLESEVAPNQYATGAAGGFCR